MTKAKIQLSAGKRQSGYIALFSTIILSAILVLLFAGMVSLVVGGMERISDEESSKKANTLAHSCAEKALAEIRENPNYSGSESYFSDTCTVGAVSENEDVRSFTATGNFSDYVKNIYVEVQIVEGGGERTLEILAWE